VKKEVETEIIIPIKGLAPGAYTFSYALGQPFFDHFENQDVREAQIEAVVAMEKQSGWIRLDVTLQGTVLRFCDRCLGDVTIPVAYNAPLMVKFSNTEEDSGIDETITLDPSAPEIDLTQYLYDSVCVSLPLQSLHPTGECDPEMEQKITELTVNR